MGEWYLESEGVQQYCRSPRLSNEYIAWPALQELCGDLKGKKVIDLGTAGGDTAKKLALLGAQCTAVDISPIMLDIAKKSTDGLDITYLQRDCSNLDGIVDNEFDLAVLNFLLCDISDLDKVSSIFKETYRVIKQGGGRAIFTFHHPLQLKLQGEHVNPQSPVSNVGPTNYFQSGAEVTRKIRTADHGITQVTNFHWSLEDYVTSFTKAGFLIDAIKEPKPVGVPQEFQETFKIAYAIPLYVVMRGIKP
ncbi:MAG: class I SAM-dependent methyltransferase [Nanoarchaeota archaeon]